jgi:hypothetical protein
MSKPLSQDLLVDVDALIKFRDEQSAGVSLQVVIFE